MVSYYKMNSYLENDRFLFHFVSHTMAPGRVTKTHAHEFIELVYVYKGEGLHVFNGLTSKIFEGHVFVIEPDLLHSYRVEPGKPPLIIYNLLIHPSLLTQELAAMSQFHSFINFFYLDPFVRKYSGADYTLHLSSLHRLEAETLIRRIGEEYKRKELGYEIRVKAQLIDLLIFLSRQYDRAKRKPLSAISDDEQIIRNICRFIEKHYAQNLSLQHIIQFCGMSQTSFLTKFKKYTGQTFVEFRNHVRTQAAQSMLQSTNMTVSQIALEVGYNHFSHFNKIFKEITGQSPKQYRMRINEPESPSPTSKIRAD